jgi:two-component system invasion response regulator UvrY
MKDEAGVIRIAVADDYEVVRRGICNELNEGVHTRVIMEAANGQQLITQLEQASLLPHICLLDISMPVLDGFKTLEILRKRWPLLKNIMYSMYEHQHTVQQLIRDGAQGFLAKQCSMTELHQAIGVVMAGHSYFPGWSADGSQYRSAGLSRKIPPLLPRELQLLRYVGSSLTYTEIADVLHCSKRSIESVRDSLFAKMQVHSRQELAIIAANMGLTPLGTTVQE